MKLVLLVYLNPNKFKLLVKNKCILLINFKTNLIVTLIIKYTLIIIQ